MINLLSTEEKKNVTKQSLIDMESDILMRLGFDFNFPGPIQSMERYLRILGYDLNRTVFDMGFQICKFQLNEALFLDYRPTQISAAAVILSINIYEEDQPKEQNDKFFKNQIKGKQKTLNVDIWNNEEVTAITGYTISDIKECLFDLAYFISSNLSPNRLAGFDIQAIKNSKPFDQIGDIECE